jgi:mxaA protein
MFFSEEKNQKTFNSCTGTAIPDLAGIVEAARELKVFCFFFSKKKFFPYLILGCLACCQSAVAQVTSVSFHGPAREFGYFAGDVLVTESAIGVVPGTVLDTRTLPVPGAVNANLDLRHIEAVQNGNSVHMRVEYQNFLAPERVMQSELPALHLGFMRGGTVYAVALPAFAFHVSPLRVPQRTDDDKADLRGNHAIALLDERRDLVRLAVSVVVACLAGLVLAGGRGWLPGLGRPARPFAIAARRVAMVAGAEADALQALHHAFDATAQRHVFAADLDDFIAAQPRYNGLRREIEAFFQRSEKMLFGRASQGAGMDLLRFARKLRRAERSWR